MYFEVYSWLLLSNCDFKRVIVVVCPRSAQCNFPTLKWIEMQYLGCSHRQICSVQFFFTQVNWDAIFQVFFTLNSLSTNTLDLALTPCAQHQHHVLSVGILSSSSNSLSSSQIFSTSHFHLATSCSFSIIYMKFN